jgi:hypothetical protein
VQEARCDPAALSVVVWANGPISRERIGADRPYLAGSPEQITGDVVGLNGLGGVDWVLFNNTAAGDVHELVRLLGELKAAVEARELSGLPRSPPRD